MSRPLLPLRRSLVLLGIWAGALPSFSGIQGAAPHESPDDEPELIELSSSAQEEEASLAPPTTSAALLLSACQSLAERGREAQAWTETWEAWHYFTIAAYASPIGAILASYLEEMPSLEELQLNEWMRYWYVCNHMPAAWQASLVDLLSLEEWLQNEEWLQQRLISHHLGAARLLGEKAVQIPTFAEQLWGWITASKQQPQAATAAANAMTILNTAAFSFSERGLRAIHVAVEVAEGQWHGPYLEGALLSGTDLRGADLRGTNFRRACLHQANLQGAQLDQADLGLPIGEWLGYEESSREVGFSPDGRLLAFVSGEKTLCLWDIQGGHCLRALSLPYREVSWIQSVCFASDGEKVATGGGGCIRIWDIESGLSICTMQEGRLDTRSIAFSPDGKQLVSAGREETIRIWDTASGFCLHTLEGHRYGVCSVSFSPDGKRFASGAADLTIRVWDSTTRVCEQVFRVRDCVESVCFSPDGQRLASASADGVVRIWEKDGEKGWGARLLEGHTHAVRCVTFSPDGTKLATASADKSVRIWDSRTGKCLRVLQGHAAQVWSVRFSPDGQTVASCSADKSVRLWRVGTGTVLHILGGKSDLPLEVHGLRLASARGLSQHTLQQLKALGATDKQG